MPTRRLEIDGRTWQVYPSGYVTQYDADEFGLIFVHGTGEAREVRLTRYRPTGARSRVQVNPVRASNAFVSPGLVPCVTSPLLAPTMTMFLKTSGTPPQLTPMSMKPPVPNDVSSVPAAALSATSRRPTVIRRRG